MLKLIDTSDPRYGGTPDPDDERMRRRAPVRSPLFLVDAGTFSCLMVAAVTGPLVTVVLSIAAMVLCALFVRAALSERRPRGGPVAPGHDPPDGALDG